MQKSFLFLMLLVSITLVSCKSNKDYILSFDSNGGSKVASINVLDVEDVVLPNNPNKLGYTFENWYYDNDTFELVFSKENLSERKQKEDLTVYAKWKIISYNIDYGLDGGINGDNTSKFDVESNNIVLKNPLKDGFEFIGWYDNKDFKGERIVEIKKGTAKNLTFYARWKMLDPLGDTQKSLSIEYNEGKDFILPSSHEDIDITWSSSNKDVVTDSGLLYRTPIDIKVTLTATLEFKDKKVTKDFDFLIKGETIDFKQSIIDLKKHYEESISNKNYVLSTNIELLDSINKIKLIWISQSETNIDNKGVISRPKFLEGNKIVKLNAKLNDDNEVLFTFYVKAEEIEETTIKSVKEQPVDTLVYFKGIVSSIKSYLIGVNDLDTAIYLFNFDNKIKLPKNLKMGDMISVSGITSTYKETTRIENGYVEIVSSGHSIPLSLNSLDGLTPDDVGKRIFVEDLTVTSISSDKRSLYVTDGVNNIEVSVYSTADINIMNYFKNAKINSIVNIIHGHLHFSVNKVKIYIYSIEEINIRISQLEQELEEAFNNIILPVEKDDTKSLNLPSSGLHDSSILWSSSHELLLNVDTGVVNLPTEDTLITLTAVITSNKDSNISITKTIDILFKPLYTNTVLINYTDDQAVYMFAGNNADKLNLNPNIFNITSKAVMLGKIGTHVKLDKTPGFILSSGNDSQGNILGISVSNDYVINSYKIYFGSVNGSVSIAENTSQVYQGSFNAFSIMERVRTLNSLHIKNIGNNSIYVKSVHITYSKK